LLIHGHHDEASVIVKVAFTKAPHIIQNFCPNALGAQTPRGKRRSNHALVPKLLVVFVRRFGYAVCGKQ